MVLIFNTKIMQKNQKCKNYLRQSQQQNIHASLMIKDINFSIYY